MRNDSCSWPWSGMLWVVGGFMQAMLRHAIFLKSLVNTFVRCFTGVFRQLDISGRWRITIISADDLRMRKEGIRLLVILVDWNLWNLNLPYDFFNTSCRGPGDILSVDWDNLVACLNWDTLKALVSLVHCWNECRKGAINLEDLLVVVLDAYLELLYGLCGGWTETELRWAGFDTWIWHFKELCAESKVGENRDYQFCWICMSRKELKRKVGGYNKVAGSYIIFK